MTLWCLEVVPVAYASNVFPWKNMIRVLRFIDYVERKIYFKATFSFHKLIPKNAQMTTLHTNWSLYITFTMIYYIRQQ